LPCRSAIIDGEVVACKKDGTPDFRALHSGNYTQETLCTRCFDLMELNGEGLRPLPLVARKLKLEALLRRHDHPTVRYSEPFKTFMASSMLSARSPLHTQLFQRSIEPAREAEHLPLAALRARIPTRGCCSPATSPMSAATSPARAPTPSLHLRLGAVGPLWAL